MTVGGAGAGSISLGGRLAVVLVAGLRPGAGTDEIQITHIAKDLLRR